jgi:hypothetical protein
MKKIYTLIALASVAFGASAQTRGSVGQASTAHKANVAVTGTVMPNSTRAIGDTLLYIPLPGYMINATDGPTFGISNEDIDGLTTNTGQPGDWTLYYSTDSSLDGSGNPTSDNYYHPWETPFPAGDDSAFFWSATSWFAPAVCCADNWLEFGPITVPANGATIVWYDKYNRYRDGYRLIVADGTGFDAATTPLVFTDFDLGTTIFTQTDDPYPSATYATDTTWTLRSANVPASFNGTQMIFAFHHNANDMDVLRLDEITVIEGTNLSIGVVANAATNKVSQNMPNPFNNSTKITYELANAAAVSLSVYDVTGKKVAAQSEGTKTAGSHTLDFNGADLAAGVYYYSMTLGENTTSTMKMVVVK